MQALEKNMTVSAIWLLFMIVTVAAVGGFMYHALSKKSEYRDKLAGEIRNIEGKISKSRQENNKLVDALNYWDSLPEGAKTMSGLRLSEAKEKLDEMVNTYWLSQVQTTFSKPAIEPHPDYSDFNISSSNVTISFDGISDTLIYAFADALRSDFPGFVTLKRFDVQQEGEMERETIKQIASGERPALFSGVVEFKWRDIKR